MKRAALLLASALVLPSLAIAKATPPTELQTLLNERLQVPVSVSAARVLKLRYPFTEHRELADFKAKSFDKCAVGDVFKEANQPHRALEIGAGSRRAGRLLHDLTFKGDFNVRVRMSILSSAPSSKVCFLLGKKVGVLWGQRLVKPSKMKPLTRKGKLDTSVFGNGRVVELTFKRRGELLTITCDGRLTDRRSFKRGELDNLRIGLVAQNVRLAIYDWDITSAINERKLPKG
jgi:hypothetical protein